MKKAVRRAAFPALLLLALALRADAARDAAQAAVRQAALVVLPSLFPFITASRMLTGSGLLDLRRGDRWSLRLFGVPSAGLGAVLMGLCGGYPLGVYTACELFESGQLTRTQAQRLLRFCNHTGPGIFFGMVGAVLFPEVRVCAALYLIHILSALLTALLVSEGGEGETAGRPPARKPETIPQAVQSAFFSALGLCGYVIFFSVLLRLVLDSPAIDWLLSHAPVDRGVAETLVCAFTDLPSGIAAMAAVADPAARFLLCAGAVSWGGLCVHMQAAGVWQAAELAPKGYYPSKALQALLSCALAFPAANRLFGASLPVWPAISVILAAILKKAVEISPRMRYNGKNEGRRRYAVPKENRAVLRLLRPGGKGG